jgi:hypothetical protein
MADVVVFNARTGERVERDFTPEEKAQRQADRAAEQARRAEERAAADAEKAARQAQRALKQSAKAKLLALGLTADEAAALAGE